MFLVAGCLDRWEVSEHDEDVRAESCLVNRGFIQEEKQTVNHKVSGLNRETLGRSVEIVSLCRMLSAKQQELRLDPRELSNAKPGLMEFATISGAVTSHTPWRVRFHSRAGNR